MSANGGEYATDAFLIAAGLRQAYVANTFTHSNFIGEASGEFDRERSATFDG